MLFIWDVCQRVTDMERVGMVKVTYGVPPWATTLPFFLAGGVTRGNYPGEAWGGPLKAG